MMVPFAKSLTIFAQSPILDVWQGSRYTSKLGGFIFGLFFKLSLRMYLKDGKTVHVGPFVNPIIFSVDKIVIHI